MPKPYTPNDRWSKKAAAEGYRARSVYKLEELDKKFALLQLGMTVLDLGAAPGSWLQYVQKKLTTNNGSIRGRIIGIDLKEIKPIEGVETYRADITHFEAINRLLTPNPIPIPNIDLILSDLAPNTSGIKDIDQWRSIELSQAVLTIARTHLKPRGRCVIKVLRGADFDEFIRSCKCEWNEVKTFIAEASRDRSKEIYVILKKM